VIFIVKTNNGSCYVNFFKDHKKDKKKKKKKNKEKDKDLERDEEKERKEKHRVTILGCVCSIAVRFKRRETNIFYTFKTE